MNIVVINFSGNVGKSTLAKHLLHPRLAKAALIPVETINSDDYAEPAMRGDAFRALLERIALEDNAIIDVGASNSEEFLSQMIRFKGSHEDFDLFLVPTVPSNKQVRDTIATLRELTEIGVPPSKILCLANMVDSHTDVDRDFEPLTSLKAETSSFSFDTGTVVHSNELFATMKAQDATIAQILDDKTDYKAAIAKTAKPEEKIALVRKLANRRLAGGVQDELDAVYNVTIRP